MIKISYKKFGIIPTSDWYFGYKKENSGWFDIVSINNLQKKIKLKGYKEIVSHTGIINLKNTVEDIFGSFTKTTRNEINRANKEGIQYDFNTNPSDEDILLYHEFYNKFLSEKFLPSIRIEQILKFKNNLVLSKSKKDGDVLSYHLYIIDKEKNRIRLFQSCSLRWGGENLGDKLKIISFGNRGLHFNDICKAKELGYEIYDFGGIDLKSNNKEYLNVAKYKESFNPQIIELYGYEKCFRFYIYKIFNLLQKILCLIKK